MKQLLAVLTLSMMGWGADKQILLIAGKPSHGAGEHEHNAGVRLLAQWLNTVPGVKASTSFSGAWPADSEFEKADAILFFSDGGDQHFAFQNGHPAVVSKAAKRGAGLMFLHYVVEPPERSGHAEMLNWLGGFFEVNYSINPIWEAHFTHLPVYPVTRGVQPFRLRDEWYTT